MDGGACRVTVHGVTKSWTRLKLTEHTALQENTEFPAQRREPSSVLRELLQKTATRELPGGPVVTTCARKWPQPSQKAQWPYICQLLTAPDTDKVLAGQPAGPCNIQAATFLRPRFRRQYLYVRCSTLLAPNTEGKPLGETAWHSYPLQTKTQLGC